MAKRVRRWSETGGSHTTAANTLTPGRICLLFVCVCVRLCMCVRARKACMRGRLGASSWLPFHFASWGDTGLGQYPSVCAFQFYVCVCVYTQSNGDDKRDHDGAGLAQGDYFKEAYGMC